MRGVRFDVPAEVAFDYLVDPVNRPQWQSSLRRIEAYDEPLVLGATWTDVTVPGLRPAMTLTVLDRPRRWTERGTWHGFSADLTLTFHEAPDRSEACVVRPVVTMSGLGPARLLAPLLVRVAPLAVLPDLRRAARLLASLRDSP